MYGTLTVCLAGNVQYGNVLSVKLIVSHIVRVGQNHIYTVYIRHFRQGNHQMYGHIWRIYTVLANPAYRTQSRTNLSRATLSRTTLHATHVLPLRTFAGQL